MLRRIFAESIYLPKTIFGYKFESHTEYKSIDNHGNTLRKCYIAYGYHITTERNTFFEVVHFTPKRLPEVKPKLQKKSYAVIELMVMTIYLSCIDRYPCFIKSNRILGSVTAFVNEGKALKVPP